MLEDAVTLSNFLATVRRALSLDRSVFVDIQTARRGLWLALSVVAFAGLSEALGQSVVLFANRVQPKRFVVALMMAASIYTFGFAFLTTSVWVVGIYVFGQDETLQVVTRAVGLGYAPYLFSFIILTPYFGRLFSLLLSFWSLFAILVAVQVTLSLSLWQAFAASVLGWLLLQTLQRTIGRPVIMLSRYLQRQAAGAPVQFGRTFKPPLTRPHDKD